MSDHYYDPDDGTEAAMEQARDDLRARDDHQVRALDWVASTSPGDLGDTLIGHIVNAYERSRQFDTDAETLLDEMEEAA